MKKKNSTTENLYEKTLGFKVPLETYLFIVQIAKEKNMTTSDVLRNLIHLGIVNSNLKIANDVFYEKRKLIGYVPPIYSAQPEIKINAPSEHAIWLKNKFAEDEKFAIGAGNAIATALLLAIIFIKN